MKGMIAAQSIYRNMNGSRSCETFQLKLVLRLTVCVCREHSMKRMGNHGSLGSGHQIPHSLGSGQNLMSDSSYQSGKLFISLGSGRNLMSDSSYQSVKTSISLGSSQNLMSDPSYQSG
jgi:hypothetical protein